jgi:hypothetical protein
MRNAENKKRRRAKGKGLRFRAKGTRRRAHGVRCKEKEERFRVQSSEVEIISPLSV